MLRCNNVQIKNRLQIQLKPKKFNKNVRENEIRPLPQIQNWPLRVSLSEIESEHTDGVIRQELVSAECVRRPEQHAVPARPCSEIHRSRDNSSQRLKKVRQTPGPVRLLKSII